MSKKDGSPEGEELRIILQAEQSATHRRTSVIDLRLGLNRGVWPLRIHDSKFIRCLEDRRQVELFIASKSKLVNSRRAGIFEE